MDMLQLDINQCPDNYYTPNAFKNTHKCDDKSSYVRLTQTLTKFQTNRSLISVCANSRTWFRNWWLQM